MNKIAASKIEGVAWCGDNLHLDPDYCLRRWNGDETPIENFDPFWKKPILNDRNFYKHFLLLCRLILDNEPSERIENLLRGHLGDLSAHFSPAEQYETPGDLLCESVARYLHEHLDDPPSLEELSRHFGYHPDVLNRRFKRRFGLSLRAYLIDRRLHRAKALLLEGGHSVARIAAEAGFYDQSHFVKAFKKAYSLPPGEYR
ncbi:AraC family transcriptional regulator [Nitratifractor sp.]|uniref:helix-turn-helix transcriptional regulator n=1 Tax=Nitratifractor sp. TaxID=2268144 RepID=UPI0025FEFF55|nr:AraC family transcriptional regulator [Nitratifractor sp.]